MLLEFNGLLIGTSDARRESSTVKDFADETKDGLCTVIVACEEPIVLNPEEPARLHTKEEAFHTQECEYCGHAPCGCGG